MKAGLWLAIVLVGLAMPAPDAGATTLEQDPATPPSASAMRVGGPTRAPIGFVRFCRTWPEECTSQNETAAVAAEAAPAAAGANSALPALTAAAWRELQRIDAEVDRDIIPMRDPLASGSRDLWSLAPASGDCEDYALTKRHRLLEAGWPAAALLVAVVRDELRGPHAVLVVRTDRGDMILDNLSARIVPWHKLPYRWIKRQSAHNPKLWVKLDGYADEMVERLETTIRHLSMNTASGPAD